MCCYNPFEPKAINYLFTFFVACKDIHSRYCPSWKRSGYCTNDRYKNYMRRNCQKTCGYCGGKNPFRSIVLLISLHLRKPRSKIGYEICICVQ